MKILFYKWRVPVDYLRQNICRQNLTALDCKSGVLVGNVFRIVFVKYLPSKMFEQQSNVLKIKVAVQPNPAHTRAVEPTLGKYSIIAFRAVE